MGWLVVPLNGSPAGFVQIVDSRRESCWQQGWSIKFYENASSGHHDDDHGHCRRKQDQFKIACGTTSAPRSL